MANRISAGIVVLSFMGAAHAQPIVSNGACPQLTRINASGDWNQFPIRPPYAANTVQAPLTPQQSINCAQVPTGLQAQIVASELTTGPAPVLGYLMYFTFDERGRVWALDVRDYPNNVTANSHITGGATRVVILEDTDGDGELDNFKVFHTGLSVGTSLEVVNGGIVVTCPPNLLFIPNNNDVAGTPQVLWNGMVGGNNYDTHGQTNSLFYSLDNWVYGHTGYDGCTTAGGPAGNGINCGGGRVWRFKHTALGSTSNAFEAWTTGPSNAHGIGQMENGEIFQSGATLSVYSNHSIRGGVASVPLVPGRVALNSPTDDYYLWEASNTAISGHDFYTARLLPAIFNTRLYICEGATKLCHQDNIAVNVNGSNTGSTWTVNRMTGSPASNIIGSTDAWFAPLKVRTGPDGALWVVDWYNYLFLHNPASPSGQNGAWCQSTSCTNQGELRVKSRTRLYRIVPSNGSTHPVLNLATATEAQLVAALSNTNFVWRMQAQKILTRRTATASLLNSLEAILTSSRTVDALGNDPAVTHAVWVLEGLGQFTSDPTRWDPILRNLLLHPAWATRRNVLMAMPRTTATSQAVSDQCSVNDDHGHVRLQALMAHAQSPNVANERAIWTTFQGVDTHAGSAVTAAGLATSATRPCTPALVTPIADAPANLPQARNDLRFSITRDGFTLSAKRQLESGELVVYDLRGQVAFRSVYNNATAQWSAPSANGLKMPVYFYTYRKFNGELLRGEITLAGMNF